MPGKPARKRVEVPGYRITGILGRGGQGVVCRAHDESSGKTVAIKFLHPKLAREKNFRERFTREINASLSISHPKIVKGIKAGSVGNLLYFVMEFAQGRPLDDLLDEEGPLPEPDLLDFASQASDALEFAHELGMVHRDVKPGNFIVSCLGEVKLLDLGMAKETGSGGSLTATGTVIGTPYYMSPEAIEDLKRVDARSDVYSLGATMYAAATGEPPFEGGSAFAIMEQVCTAQARPPMDLNPSISAGLQAVILKAIEKDPKMRYQSALKLRIDVERIRKGKEPLASGARSGRHAGSAGSAGFLRRMVAWLPMFGKGNSID